jgi:LPS O-antigen subunit length determinant protein (WzzB/FepE family)
MSYLAAHGIDQKLNLIENILKRMELVVETWNLQRFRDRENHDIRSRVKIESVRFDFLKTRTDPISDSKPAQ